MTDHDNAGKINGKHYLEGTITPRRCDCCGHHEIGMTTPDGEYIALKPGMRIMLELPV